MLNTYVKISLLRPSVLFRPFLILSCFLLLLCPKKGQAQTYCQPVYQWGCGGIAITSFTLDSINHSGNACNGNAYNDFTSSQSTTLTPGNAYTWSVTTSYNNHNLAIWIDFNDDGDFDDSGELIYTTSSLGVASDNFTLPTTANSGTHRLRVRMKFHNPAFQANESCTQMNEGETHDYSVTIAPGSNMSIDSSTAIQPNTQMVPQGFSDREIIGIVVYAQGGNNPLDVTELFLNTSGTTNSSDISSAKVYFTGSSSSFNTSNQFGSSVNNPSGNFSVSGNQTLSPGANYFWLAYDISGTATIGNLVDAAYDSITIDGQTYFPAIASPSGSREIIEPMAGTYTIGTNNRDYSTFDSAIMDLNLRGVSGAVIFRVDAGNYNEQVILTEIEGVSSSNTITFSGAGMNATNINYTQNVTDSRYTIRFDGAKWITFENMTIEANASGTYGWAVHITNNSSDISIQNNRIVTSGTGSSANYHGIVVSSSNTAYISATSLTVTNLLVQNNELVGGNTNISLNESTNSKILNNHMINAYNYGVLLNEDQNPLISGNLIDVRSVNGSTSSYGIFANSLQSRVEITANIIINAGRYGINISGAPATSGNPSLIANNSIGAGFRHNSAYGINMGSSANTNIFNNSVNVNGSSAMAIYVQASATNLRILNNSFAYSGTGGGYAMAVLNSASITEIDHNNYFSGGSSFVYYGGASPTDIQALRAINIPTGNDANSIAVDPQYLSATNLVALNTALIDAGTPINTITTDIEGSPRGTVPDIGAYEALSNNLAAIATGSGLWDDMCGDLNTSVDVEVINMGTGTQTNVPVTVIISGNISDTITAVLSSIDALADTTFTVGTFDSKSGGQITITAFTGLSGDGNNSNDTVSRTITVRPAPAAPTGTSVISCSPGSFPLVAASVPGETVVWYDNMNKTSVIHTGDTFVTPYLSNSTTYYAASGNVNSDRLTTNYSGTTDGAGGVFFDVTALNTVSIDSFAVNFSLFATAADSMVSVYYKENTYQGFESDSAAWTLLGTVSVTSAGTGVPTLVNVGKSLQIPAGKTYGLHLHYFARFSNTAPVYSNADIILQGGTGTAFRDPFQGLHYNNVTFNGDIYYRTFSCQSELISLDVEINEGPDSLKFIPAAVFQGEFNYGGAQGIDRVCAGDTLSYELFPHIGFGNDLLDSTWAINSFSFETSNGTQAVNSSWITPTASDNGIFTFIPALNEGDSVFVLEISVELLTTGCDTTIRRFINVLPRPVASFTAVDGCLSDSVSFTNTTSFNGSGAINYSWDFGDGNTASDENPKHLYTTAGEYTVVLTVEGAQGCADMFSTQIEIFDAPEAIFTVTGECANDSIAFNSSSVVHPGTVTYTWNFGDNNSSADENPAHHYGLQGNYDVTLIIDNNGCVDSATQTLNILVAPVAGFTTENFCFGDTLEFTNTSTTPPGNVDYRWYFDEEDTSTAPAPSYVFANAGEYEISMVAELANGCTDSITQNITIFELPNAGFSFQQWGAGEVSFTADESGHVLYEWSLGDGDSSYQTNPTHQYTNDGNYDVSLKVTSDEGCVADSTRSISVNSVSVNSLKLEDGFNAFPNPYRETTTVEYTLERNAQIQLTVYDVTGKVIAVLLEETQTAGKHNYHFSSLEHMHLPGTYFVELKVDGQSFTKRLVKIQ